MCENNTYNGAIWELSTAFEHEFVHELLLIIHIHAFVLVNCERAAEDFVTRTYKKAAWAGVYGVRHVFWCNNTLRSSRRTHKN